MNIWFVFFVALMGLQTSCLTYRWKVEVTSIEEVAKTKKAVPKDKLPSFLSVAHSEVQPNHFVFQNKGEDTVFVVYKLSVAQSSGISSRLISGETKGIHSDRESPDTPIAPGSSTELSFYPPGNNLYDSMQKTGAPIEFRVVVKDSAGIKHTALIYSSRITKVDPDEEEVEYDEYEMTTSVSDGDKIGCLVTGIFYGGWCWLINPDGSDYARAKETAAKKYKTKKEAIELKFLNREI